MSGFSGTQHETPRRTLETPSLQEHRQVIDETTFARARDPARFGAWVENACIAHAVNSGQHVHYWREEPFEVDAVTAGDWGAWAIEIKTGRFSSVDLGGLAEFTRRHPAFAPLVVTDPGHVQDAAACGFPALAWDEFLLTGPPKGQRA